ncbi:MAG TPA: SRPBCC family protein [Acidimicrobiales bacterium]|jgi:hypothetical protein|nr:SRPBCC family protein [Acidimicrobiales bacterium]
MPTTNGRWWLTTDSRHATIRATAEKVYDLVADLPRMGEWSPECQQVEWTDGSTEPVVGATFVGHNKGGPAGLMRWSRRGRVLAAERGRSFAFVTEEGGRESTEWRYTFEQVEGGTRVTESYNVRWIPTWARIVDVPTNRCKELAEAMEHTLDRLKAAAETSSVHRSSS